MFQRPLNEQQQLLLVKCIIAKYQNGDVCVSCKLAKHLEAASSELHSESSDVLTKERLVGIMQHRLNTVQPYFTQWLILCEFVISELQYQGRYIELRELC